MTRFIQAVKTSTHFVPLGVTCFFLLNVLLRAADQLCGDARTQRGRTVGFCVADRVETSGGAFH